ncbi:small oligopeptide transporter, partial [Wolfiporia cocos MD-104 SS10]
LEAADDDSPYPEVRSAVANYDDPSMPVTTIRSWMLGVCWAIVLPGVNQFYYFRYPSLLVGPVVAQLATFPLGRAWARFVPRVKLFGVSLNPGPFTIKEHVFVTIMAGVGAQYAYATGIVAVQRLWYHQNFSFIYKWMLVMSTQLIGFSFGGLARRGLIDDGMRIAVWPSTLVECALFNTLHSQSYAGIGERDGMSRERFFTYAFASAVAWYFVPGYLFQALSVFTWGCWIAPDNIVVNQLFGYHSGLGFSLLSFDWNEIAFIGSPLATPWWAEANIIAGFMFFYWFLVPLLYFKNVWYSQYMPISSSSPYDNTGNVYNQTRILKPDATFDFEEYKNYSPLFLPMTFAMSYGLSFATITAVAVHSILYLAKPFMIYIRQPLSENSDIHAQLMSRYPQVPHWWYACILAVTFLFSCLCIKLWPTDMTIWALIIALLIALLYMIPAGMIQAVTNQQIGLNVITELIVGYMLPGKPVAMMMFKTWGYITMSQTMMFASDFKLGHYMKIPPRPMFWCQVISTMIAGTVQLGIETWYGHASGFTCANSEVFATASIVWGVIGPALTFSKGRLYYPLLFFFILGAVCPLIVWALSRKYPKSFLNYVNLMFTGLLQIPPATAVNYVPWAILGFLFQYVIRRRHFSFWAKYNYVLSAALDGGTTVSTILIYFWQVIERLSNLQYPQNGRIGEHTIQQWWGNTVFKNTTDWNSVPMKGLPAGQTFGYVLVVFIVSRYTSLMPDERRPKNWWD